MARRKSGRFGWVWLVVLVVAAFQFVNRLPGPDTTPRPEVTTSAPATAKSAAPLRPSPLKASAQPSRAAPATHSVAANSLRVRGLPTTAAEVLTELPRGSMVTILASSDGWGLVGLADGRQGWVSIEYLAPLSSKATPPTTQEPIQLFTPPAKTKSKPAIGQPLRDAYVGTCDCPYDRKRNGARCGGTSAYSRPGGRSPACYVGD